MNDDTPEFNAEIEDAWGRFEESLSRALMALEDGESLIVEVLRARGEDSCGPYVQALREHNDFLLEVSSNNVLDDAWKLSGSDTEALQELGFTDPDKDMPNHWTELGFLDIDRGASMAVKALREVWHIAHPALLSGSGVNWESQTAPAPNVPSTDGTPAHANNRHDLDELIDQSLEEAFGQRPERDSDGDIPIPTGTGVVYVRTHDESPLIRLFAVMVKDLQDHAAALHEVAAMNRDIESVKFLVYKDSIIATVDMWAQPFAAAQLHRLIGLMCDAVAQHDTDLARRVKGRVFTTPADETAATDDDGIHPVMRSIMQLDAEHPGALRPKDAAKLCDYNPDLLLELIHWNEEQEIAWREARDAAQEPDEILSCDAECEHARRTVKLLRKALKKVLLG